MTASTETIKTQNKTNGKTPQKHKKDRGNDVIKQAGHQTLASFGVISQKWQFVDRIHSYNKEPPINLLSLHCSSHFQASKDSCKDHSSVTTNKSPTIPSPQRSWAVHHTFNTSLHCLLLTSHRPSHFLFFIRHCFFFR